MSPFAFAVVVATIVSEPAPVTPGHSTPTFVLVIGAVGAALVTGYITWRISKRLNSGSIDTSAAADLWTESQAMRKELRDETVSLRSDIDALRRDLAGASQRAANAEAETVRWRDQALALGEEVAHLRRQVATCQRQLRDVRAKQRKAGK